jgi:hypothetical protein
VCVYGPSTLVIGSCVFMGHQHWFLDLNNPDAGLGEDLQSPLWPYEQGLGHVACW